MASTRNRTTAQVVALLVGAALLLWGGDTLARIGAESLLARDVQDATGVAQRPEVEIHGPLFLPQVVRGAYTEVDVAVEGVEDGPSRLDRVESRLFDVRLPFHDVLLRDVRQVGVGRSEELVRLRYDDVNAYLEATGRPLRLRPADDGEVEVTGTVTVLGRDIDATAEVSLSVEGGEVRVTPREIETGTDTLDRASRLLLGQRLTVGVHVGNLPFGQQLVDVQPYASGLLVRARGRAVILDP